VANRTAVSGRTAPATDRCGLQLDRWPPARPGGINYREIRDLSHTYPTEENERIIDWLYRDPVIPEDDPLRHRS
jgi:hypothetical protein